MGQLVFQATLGGQVNLVGPNTASTFNLDVPAVSATLATTAANTFTAVQTFTAGSAAAPAITTTGDTNTGIFFPAADTIAFSEGGTESARIDSAGNFGLGVTPSAWSGVKALQVGSGGALFDFGSSNVLVGSNVYFDGTNNKYINTDSASYYQQNNGSHVWAYAASGTAGNAITFTQAMTLDASGNLGIGTTSPGAKLEVNDATRASVFVQDSAGRRLRLQSPDSSANPATIGTSTNHDLVIEAGSSAAGNIMRFNVGGSERAQIDSSGNLLVGATGTVNNERLRVDANVANFGTRLFNSNASPSGVTVGFIGAAPNGTGNPFISCGDTATDRFIARSNGGLANYSGNDVNLSDRREKTNFAPAKSYLETICAIPVQTFNYVDQNHEEDPGLTLGVVAQDVQEVAPELVMESNWAKEGDEPKMRLSIYQTDLQYALMKSIQELKAIVGTQAARITALEAK
jgi:hypothetical protein